MKVNIVYSGRADMAYVIDERSIRITDRHTNSYFIGLEKITFMIFKKENLSIYLDGREVRFDAKDYLHADELRRMYYSLLTTLTAPAAPPLVFKATSPVTAPNTTKYGKLPESAITRSLAMAQGSSARKKADDNDSDKDENIFLLRSSKKP